MKYLKIQNNGVLDIRLVALMGGSTKIGDKFKIGQFGTGLKYTLAYLFRNNIDFKIYSGEALVTLTTDHENINETNFEIICIDGHRTSITTGMGLQWDAWMIIRELWCNALDEGGNIKEVVTSIGGLEGKTTFYIQITPEIQNVIDNWRSYFIHTYDPLWENEKYAIHINKTDGPLQVYKNGVLIYQNTDVKSLFLYDIKQADINELREFRGSVHWEVMKALENPGKEVISYFLNNITDKCFEGSELEYDWYTSFTSIWKETIGQNRIAESGSYDYYREHGAEIDFSNVLQLPKKVYKALIKSFDGLGVLAMSDSKVEFYQVEKTGAQESIIECLSILNEAGYKYDAEIVFKHGIFKDHKKLTASNRRDKTVMVSELFTGQSVESRCAFLVEEIEYIQSGFNRDDQRYTKHFIDLYTRQLLATNSIEI